MLTRKMVLSAACLAIVGSNFTPLAVETPDIVTLKSYLESHWQKPEEYVVSKFKKYDYVFIGEYHKIKQDLLLIQSLIPELYKAGIYHLGIEFGNHDYQNLIDSLVTAEEYDADLARWISFKHITWWGYSEYQDIYRAAWKLNSSLPDSAQKFRVVALNYSPDYSKLTEQGGDENWKEVHYKGDIDSYLAKMIFEEFVSKGVKALIYSGAHHAFTKYHQPVFDADPFKFYRFVTDRMGNQIYDSIPECVFNIFLHSPWQTKFSGESYESPMMGIIDSVMADFESQRVGFDCLGTPLGDIRDTVAYYSVGYDDFELADFCDGYIYMGDFCSLEGSTPDTLFVTEDNLKEAIKGIMTWKGQQNYKTVSDFIETFKYYTLPAVLFPGLCPEKTEED